MRKDWLEEMPGSNGMELDGVAKVAGDLSVGRADRIVTRMGDVQEVEYEILVRFLPAEFRLMYETLVLRGLIVGGSLRGGQGYDESLSKGEDKNIQASVKKRTSSSRLRASPPGKFGSGKSVIRSEGAVAFRSKIDRRLRRIGKEMKAWLESEAVTPKLLRRCTSAKCGRFAEENWWFCPNCGTVTDEVKK